MAVAIPRSTIGSLFSHEIQMLMMRQLFVAVRWTPLHHQPLMSTTRCSSTAGGLESEIFLFHSHPIQYLPSLVEIDLFFITLSCAWWIRDAPPVVPAPHPQMSLPSPLPGCHDYQMLISPKSGDQVLQVNAPYKFYLHDLFPFII
jgi:hypothetical protein